MGGGGEAAPAHHGHESFDLFESVHRFPFGFELKSHESIAFGVSNAAPSME
jgi:hypothetical protein